jgi:hypothetical protein
LNEVYLIIFQTSSVEDIEFLMNFVVEIQIDYKKLGWKGK